jgi:hypothetical protein
MSTCKRVARAKVQTGYDLRPEPWSDISELDHQKETTLGLIDDSIFPPKFSVGDNDRPFESRVLWDVILNTLQELGYQQYLNRLDNMMATATMAVYCALLELSSGKLVNVEFEAETFGGQYETLKTYISQRIASDKEFSRRWYDYEQVTITRLLQI